MTMPDCRKFASARFLLIVALLGATAAATGADAIHVHNTTELLAAIAEANGERSIHLARGSYRVEGPLVIPDHTALVGEGRMQPDELGRALGFEPGTETIIRATKGFTGDLLTLGDGASLRGLVLQDIADEGRIGNVVSIKSRKPADIVSADIDECEIRNPNAMGFSDEGPSGHGVVVLSRDPALHLPPLPHVGATLDVRIRSSIVRATRGDGGGVFVINFASGAKTRLEMSHNRIEARLGAAAGVNRPDVVTDAQTLVESEQNLYTLESSELGAYNWSLIAASNAPHFAARGSKSATANVLRVRSAGDEIDSAGSGILAVAARRALPESGLVSANTLELDLEQMRIRTARPDAADLALHATLSLAPAPPNSAFDVGDDNRLRVHMNGVHGSGRRNNEYAVHAGPPPVGADSGNVLEIGGDRESFARANPEIDPIPPAEFFVETQQRSRAPVGGH